MILDAIKAYFKAIYQEISEICNIFIRDRKNLCITAIVLSVIILCSIWPIGILHIVMTLIGLLLIAVVYGIWFMLSLFAITELVDADTKYPTVTYTIIFILCVAAFAVVTALIKTPISEIFNVYFK